jgi:hypothetical protein
VSSIAIGSITLGTAGATNYELVEFVPGTVERDNVMAESRWLDGGSLVSSRRRMVTMRLVARVTGSTVGVAAANAQALADALDNDGAEFTITETIGSTSYTYDCLPATVSVGRDPVLMQGLCFIVTASIPAQPQSPVDGS